MTVTGQDQQEAEETAQTLGLTPELYLSLKQVAYSRLRNRRPGSTLNCTALVHEALLKVLGSDAGPDRLNGHFMAVVSMAMRQILVDYDRRRNAEKRGSGALHITLQEAQVADTSNGIDLLELDAALTKLALKDPLLEKLVALRFFGGLSMEQAAKALDKPKRNLERDWTRARIYLYRELQPHGG